MAQNSAIEWTDATWNFLAGCTHKSPGCLNCYAEPFAHRLAAMAEADIAAGKDPGGKRKYIGTTKKLDNGRIVWTGKVNFDPEALMIPLKRRKPTMYFVDSQSDMFHEAVDFDWVDRAFAVMALCPQHTFQILTKRPERMAEYLSECDKPIGSCGPMAGRAANDVACDDRININIARLADMPPYKLRSMWPLPNVWLGCSVENQEWADNRRDPLRQVAEQGWTTFVSYEPALGPVDWSGWEFLRWHISGGESGYAARPSHPNWHRAARDFCQANGIAYFFKQHGEWIGMDDYSFISMPSVDGCQTLNMIPDGRMGDALTPEVCREAQTLPTTMIRVGKKAAGRLLDDREWSEFPEPAKAH